MLALDTNIVVRVVTDDDPLAAIRARRLVDENDVYIGVTVLLETAWVLEHRYDLTSHEVVDALRAFAGMRTVTVQETAEVHRAMNWCAAGMDFADAMHLSLSDKLDGFATFDKDLRDLARLQGRAVIEP